MKKAVYLAGLALLIVGCGGGGGGGGSTDVGPLAGIYNGQYLDEFGNTLGPAAVEIETGGKVEALITNSSNGFSGNLAGKTNASGNFKGKITAAGLSESTNGTIILSGDNLSFAFSFNENGTVYIFNILAVRQ